MHGYSVMYNLAIYHIKWIITFLTLLILILKETKATLYKTNHGMNEHIVRKNKSIHKQFIKNIKHKKFLKCCQGLHTTMNLKI